MVLSVPIWKSLEENIRSLEWMFSRTREKGKGTFTVTNPQQDTIEIFCTPGMHAAHLLMEYFVRTNNFVVDRDTVISFFRSDATPDTWHIHPVCEFLLKAEVVLTISCSEIPNRE